MRDLQAEETSFSAVFRRQLSFLTPRARESEPSESFGQIGSEFGSGLAGTKVAL
jgi:hypothetical protein